MTTRLQLSRRRGWRLPDGARSVAYPSPFANPYRPAKRSAESNAEAVESYRRYLDDHPELIERARRELAGRDLACWCPLDLPCHADVLSAVANDPDDEEQQEAALWAEHAAFWTSHGITRDVWRRRRYARWTRDDVAAVQRAYVMLGNQRGYMTRLARQSDGWVMARYAPPGLGLDPVYAEIRPDKKVRTGPDTVHYHGDLPLWLSDDEIGDLKRERTVFTPAEMRGHIDRSRDETDHHGVNSEGVHAHPNEAKYVFPPSGKVPVWADDEHDRTIMVTDTSENRARRIDVHPDAVELIRSQSRVFFALEGVIKADSILSAGAAVFDVPSVSLWEARELRAFADEYLKGKQICIVPDADAYQNDLVMMQARLCRTWLETRGFTALITLPPRAAYEKDNNLKGIDDYLASGGTLDDLDVLHREAPYRLSEWVQERHHGYESTMRMAIRALYGLAMNADAHGDVRFTLSALARAMDVEPWEVQRAVKKLRAMGAVAVHGDLRIKRDWRSRHLAWMNAEKPRITIIDPALRGRDLPDTRLGDYTE